MKTQTEMEIIREFGHYDKDLKLVDLLEKLEQAVREETAMQIIHDINLPLPDNREPGRASITWGIMKGWGITPEDMKTFVPKLTSQKEELRKKDAKLPIKQDVSVMITQKEEGK